MTNRAKLISAIAVKVLKAARDDRVLDVQRESAQLAAAHPGILTPFEISEEMENRAVNAGVVIYSG